jgi:hypothetical protein
MWQGVDPGASTRGRVVFDGAHGIGAPKLQLLSPYMTGLLNIEVSICTCCYYLLLDAVSARRDLVVLDRGAATSPCEAVRPAGPRLD